jgi:hypothetical protein
VASISQLSKTVLGAVLNHINYKGEELSGVCNGVNKLMLLQNVTLVTSHQYDFSFLRGSMGGV